MSRSEAVSSHVLTPCAKRTPNGFDKVRFGVFAVAYAAFALRAETHTLIVDRSPPLVLAAYAPSNLIEHSDNLLRSPDVIGDADCHCRGPWLWVGKALVWPGEVVSPSSHSSRKRPAAALMTGSPLRLIVKSASDWRGDRPPSSREGSKTTICSSPRFCQATKRVPSLENATVPDASRCSDDATGDVPALSMIKATASAANPCR